MYSSNQKIKFNSIKPSLKKVSKYENKFAKLQKKAAEFNFRNQLKTVKKKEFTIEDDHESVSILTSKIVIFYHNQSVFIL